MHKFKIGDRVKLVKFDRTKKMSLYVYQMGEKLYRVFEVMRLSPDAICVDDYLWYAADDFELFVEQNIKDVNPPVLTFDSKNLM